MRRCHECGKDFAPIHVQRRCNPCHRVFFPLMEDAHRVVKNAVRVGVLPSLSLNELPCVDCGKRAHCYDHRDYAKPLDVEPVCRKCNYKRGAAAPLLEQSNAA